MATFCVTGSAGHLGEALVRTLSEQGHRVEGLDVRTSPSHRDHRLHHRPRRRPPRPRRRRPRPAHRNHAQTAHRLAPPPGLRRHQHHGARSPAGTGREACVRSVVFTSSTSALAGPSPQGPARPPWGHRGRHTEGPNVYGATKIVRRPLRAGPREPRPSRRRPAHRRFFPEPDDRDDIRARVPLRHQPEGQRVPAPPRRPRRRRRAHLRAAHRAPDLGFGATSSAPPPRSPATTSATSPPTRPP